MRIPLALIAACALTSFAHAATEKLFDGATFAGWEGDIKSTWRIVEGAIVGGSLTKTVPRNEFLATTKSYSEFDLRLKFRLIGREGFVNAGIQFRSERNRRVATLPAVSTLLR